MKDTTNAPASMLVRMPAALAPRLRYSGTITYPAGELPQLPVRYRGLPVIDSSQCPDGCKECVEACPTQAISLNGTLKIDLGRCLFCTDCLEQGNGGSLVEAAKQLDPAPSTLMIVTQPRRLITIRRALAAGCDGMCLESQIGRGKIVQALQAVAHGAAYTEQSLRQQYFESYAGLSTAPLALLSDREVEVLQLITANASNQEIAQSLFISVETVKSHVAQIFNKLPARSRLHAAVKGIRLGLVDWPEDR